MNITLIVICFLMLFKIIRGYDKGFVKGIREFIALVVTLIVLLVLYFIYCSFQNQSIASLVLLVLALIIIGAVYNIIHMLLGSVSLLTHLPILRWLDSVLGACLGLCGAVIIIWIVLVINQTGVLGDVGIIIEQDFSENGFLQLVDSCNYFVNR